VRIQQVISSIEWNRSLYIDWLNCVQNALNKITIAMEPTWSLFPGSGLSLLTTGDLYSRLKILTPTISTQVNSNLFKGSILYLFSSHQFNVKKFFPFAGGGRGLWLVVILYIPQSSIFVTLKVSKIESCYFSIILILTCSFVLFLYLLFPVLYFVLCTVYCGLCTVYTACNCSTSLHFNHISLIWVILLWEWLLGGDVELICRPSTSL